MRTPISVVLFATALAGFAGPARADDFVLVRNAANPKAKLSVAEARDLMIGRTKTWAGGVVQVVLLPAEAPPLGEMARVLFGTSAKVFLTKVKQEVFKGGLGVVSAAAGKSLPEGVTIVAIGN